MGVIGIGVGTAKMGRICRDKAGKKLTGQTITTMAELDKAVAV